jgi:hypothetical protein
MAETAAHPYATHLDIKFDPLTLIDVSSRYVHMVDECEPYPIKERARRWTAQP